MGSKVCGFAGIAKLHQFQIGFGEAMVDVLGEYRAVVVGFVTGSKYPDGCSL